MSGVGSDPAASSWDDISAWWVSEVADDPVYREDVGPMLERLLVGDAEPVLDLGCGEGQWLRHMVAERSVFGVDSSLKLLRRATRDAPVLLARLPDLRWARSGSAGAAVSVFVLDLIEEHRRFFSETARVVESGGSLVVIINHPAFTAPGSGPFMDPDFDVFWRWGSYLTEGSSEVPAGSGAVEMYHRSTAEILTAAADAGWILSEMIEAPLGPAAIKREPSYAGQEGIPRFLGVRWRR